MRPESGARIEEAAYRWISLDIAMPDFSWQTLTYFSKIVSSTQPTPPQTTARTAQNIPIPIS
jgi:hypothetical protein